MTSAEEVREFCLSLPRTTLGYVRDSARYRIGRIVYAGVARDEELIGFAFPKEERSGLVAAEPAKFQLPRPCDLRYNWVVGRLAVIDHDELRELLVDAWSMCVPKGVNREYRIANDWPLVGE
ncbi:MAG TPA: MmcQ/YjbR family DNA-binding protein [Mycobacteriales bacterium]|nr:MmcQ/YjbR family DNA-binding protein [Mycobacteriales bacterium]